MADFAKFERQSAHVRSFKHAVSRDGLTAEELQQYETMCKKWLSFFAHGFLSARIFKKMGRKWEN